MSGITKRKYIGETMRYNKKIKRPLYLIAEILPPNFDKYILLEYFKKYYPMEWNQLVQMQESYSEKDKFLLSVGKKQRYKPVPVEKYFFSLPVIKSIVAKNAKRIDENTLTREERISTFKKFENKRKAAINKYNAKIESQMELVQEIDPYYADYYIAAYHKNGISIDDKVEIVRDLSKYSSKKIDIFFHKLNDSEHNDQVRKMAFAYLQNTGKYVKLRKNFKGKKKIYITETTDFNKTPEDLYKRISALSNIQSKKKFDIFISHSFTDQQKIIALFKFLNQKGIVCYCDWTSDEEFLKRSMAGKYTEEVLKKRIQQSKLVLYVKSERAAQSQWVSFELEYAKSIEKEIKEVGIESIITEENLNEILTILD